MRPSQYLQVIVVHWNELYVSDVLVPPDEFTFKHLWTIQVSRVWSWARRSMVDGTFRVS